MRPTIIQLGVFGWICAWIVTSPALAQQEFSVPPEPTCAACSLTFTRIATLGGDTEAEGFIANTSAVVRDSEGILYVAPTYTPGVINKYTPAGIPADLLGRSGSGPGEHRAITELAIGPGDSLYAFDHRNARFSIWAPDGEFRRVGRLPGYPYEAIVLPDGRIVLQAWMRTPKHAGFPIHLLNTDGRILRSFGSDTGGFRNDDPLAGFRALALTGNGSIWSGRHNRYELELWSLDGELQKRYMRDVPWFPPRTGLGQPPQPTLRALEYDENGMLWVLINVPDPEWDGEFGPDARPSIKAFFDFLAPGVVPIKDESEDGSLHFEIWKVELRR